MTTKKHTYFSNTKNILVSLIFIFPFVLLYEIICFFYFQGKNYQIRNSADVIIRDFFNLFGSFSDEIYSITLFAILLFIYFINKGKNKKISINYRYLILMFIEGIIFGFLLLLLLNDVSIFYISENLYRSDLLLNLYLCIGAGIWEEILFRLLLFSFLYKIIRSFFKGQDVFVLFLSIILSSILFSLFHYIGNNADFFTLNTFLIRTFGGIFLGLLYYYRGFGIVVISHISYDFILVSLPLIYTN